MNWNALWGTLLAVYGLLVWFIAFKKPTSMWEMAKIKGFRKVLGDKGTVIFFYIWGAIAVGFAIWFFVATPVG